MMQKIMPSIISNYIYHIQSNSHSYHVISSWNHSPSKSGYERYKHCKMDDAIASKGIIWCYFDDVSLLVINTYLEAAGDIECRLKQLDHSLTISRQI